MRFTCPHQRHTAKYSAQAPRTPYATSFPPPSAPPPPPCTAAGSLPSYTAMQRLRQQRCQLPARFCCTGIVCKKSRSRDAAVQQLRARQILCPNQTGPHTGNSQQGAAEIAEAAWLGQPTQIENTPSVHNQAVRQRPQVGAGISGLRPGVRRKPSASRVPRRRWHETLSALGRPGPCSTSTEREPTGQQCQENHALRILQRPRARFARLRSASASHSPILRLRRELVMRGLFF